MIKNKNKNRKIYYKYGIKFKTYQQYQREYDLENKLRRKYITQIIIKTMMSILKYINTYININKKTRDMFKKADMGCRISMSKYLTRNGHTTISRA